MQFFHQQKQLHDANIAKRGVRNKLPLIVKLEKRDFQRHSFSIDPLAHQFLDEVENIIKRRVELHRPQNVHELADAIQAEWHLLTPCDLLPLNARLAECAFV